MHLVLLVFLVSLGLSPQPAAASGKGNILSDAEVFSRSINMRHISVVLYPDGTFDRRATFYPSKSKKHWGTTMGTWSRTADGRFCLKRTSHWFHDSNSTRLFSEGSCLRVYRNARGTVRAEIRHTNNRGKDEAVKLVAAWDGFHFPSLRAMQASGARQLLPQQFLGQMSGRSYVVRHWLGLPNFAATRKPVFKISDLVNGRGRATDRRGRTTEAVLTTKGKSLCTDFTFKRLWAKGCGTIWQMPDGRIYVVSDVSGFAYIGGRIQ